MNQRFSGSGGQIQPPDGNAIRHQGGQTARMIRVEMGQNDRVRRDAVPAKVAAEHAALRAGVQHDGLLLIQQKRGVRVSGAELNVFRALMDRRNQGQGDEAAGERRQDEAKAPGPADQDRDGQQQQRYTQQGPEAGGGGPEGDMLQTGEGTDHLQQPLGHPGGHPGRHPRDSRQRKAEHHRPVHPDQEGGEQGDGDAQQHGQERQGLIEIQLRRQNAQLGAQGHGEQITDSPQQSGPGLPHALHGRQHHGDPQHCAEAQQEGGARQLHGGQQQQENHDGAEQMQAGPGPGQNPPLQRQQRQQGGAEHGLTGSAQQAVGGEQHGVQQKAHPLRQAQQAEQERQQADQDPDMESADRQNMRQAQTGKGLPVLRGNHRPGAQQQGDRIGAGFLSHELRQAPGEGGTKGRGGARQGKAAGQPGFQLRVSVNADQNMPPEQRFPKIIAAGIIRAPGMIHGGPQRDPPPGDELLRRSIGVEGPPGAAGNGGPVQRHIGQHGANLAENAEMNLIGNDAGNRILSLGRKRRMPGDAGGQHAQAHSQGQGAEETPRVAPDQQHGKHQRAGQKRPEGCAHPLADQNAEGHAGRGRGQEPGALAGRHGLQLPNLAAQIPDHPADLSQRGGGFLISPGGNPEGNGLGSLGQAVIQRVGIHAVPVRQAEHGAQGGMQGLGRIILRTAEHQGLHGSSTS